MLEEKYKKYVIDKEPIPASDPDVRQEILESWRRLQHSNVSNETADTHVSPEELDRIMEENALFYEIGHSYLSNLHKYMDNATLLLSMTDINGVVIDFVGVNDTLANITADTNLYRGCLRDEAHSGTTGVSMSLREQRPYQVQGKEQYCQVFHNYIGTAAPVHDENGHVIGVVGSVTPLADRQQKFLLAMISSVADAVSNEYAMRVALDKTEYVRRQLATTIESFPSGILVIDDQGGIIRHNNIARQQLRLRGELVGARVDRIITPKKNGVAISRLEKDIHGVEYNVEDDGRVIKTISVTASQIYDAEHHISGKVILLDEIERVHQLVGRVSGFRANYTFDSIIGESTPILQAKSMARIMAESTSNVLILGGSGTGKELFAQAIHNASDRANKPFIAVNCGSLPRELIESELFGYVPGAFTGASRNGQPGKFELADGGTIFLDEIGEMPLDLQVNLLRVLQNHSIMRLGDTALRQIDVRVIAATNEDLEEAVSNSDFRGDLYYRLNVLSLEIPELRERKSDIPLLARHFLKEKNYRLAKNVTEISDEAMRILNDYEWPGNVRELENVIERAVNLASTKRIDITDLPERLIERARKPGEYIQPERKPAPQTRVSGREVFIDELSRVLREEKGNVTKAAQRMGVSKRTLYRRIEKYNINIEEFRF